MHKLTQLIENDMKPALGVTEPGAIAFAVSTAKEYVKGEIEFVQVLLNSAMYKNAFTCGIPNSDQAGNVFAAALGAVAAESSLGLESLAHVTPQDNTVAEQLIKDGKVKVKLDHMGFDIDIKALVKSKTDTCEVHIMGSHTNIKRIIHNEKIIMENPDQEKTTQEKIEIHRYTLEELFYYVDTVDVDELSFIKKAFVMNMELLEAGLKSERTTFVHQLKNENHDEIFSDNVLKTAQLLCNGAIEARVIGLDKPAMSITGSGAHGIIATLPLYAYYKIKQPEIKEEHLLRATALSYLVTMYIKEFSGKLSAFCGCGIAAGTGMACGMAYLRKGNIKELTRVIQNMAAGITGMICDGGNQGCVMKGIVATDAAFRSVDMAMADICVNHIHGILGKTPELTMKYMGMIASPGMAETERTIVAILEEKGSENEQS
ncbi:MAG: L-serine ammonia-lyase, iron-sulfur-dependent, subunit alpha [Lachnospiraceae bacterium]